MQIATALLLLSFSSAPALALPGDAPGEIGPNDFRVSDMGPDFDASYWAIAPSGAYNAARGELLLGVASPFLAVVPGGPWVPGAGSDVSLSIPNDPSALGVAVHGQGLVVDPQATWATGVPFGLTEGIMLSSGTDRARWRGCARPTRRSSRRRP